MRIDENKPLLCQKDILKLQVIYLCIKAMGCARPS